MGWGLERGDYDYNNLVCFLICYSCLKGLVINGEKKKFYNDFYYFIFVDY